MATGVNSQGQVVVVPAGWPSNIPYDGPAVTTGTPETNGAGAGVSFPTSLPSSSLSGPDQAQLNSEINASGNWSDLMGYVIATGQLPPPGALTAAGQQAVGLMGPNNIPTLQALQQYADLTGLTPANMPGSSGLTAQGGTPTLAAQTLQGFVGGLPTTTEQQVASQQIASILAANNPANPFTYLSKLNNINQLGDTSSLLRNAMQQVTGYSTSQLAQQPTISQASLLGSLYGGISAGPQNGNPNQTPGGQTIFQPRGVLQTQNGNPPSLSGQQPDSNMQQLMAYLHQSKPGSSDTAMSDNGNSGMWGQLMSYLHNSKPTATPTYDNNGNITAWTPLQTGTGQSANPLSAALPNLASMSNSQNPAGSNFVTGTTQPSLTPGQLSGWGLSNQALNKMAPSASSALFDYIQNAGGANPADAAAAAKMGGPEFGKAANGTFGQMGTI